MEAIDKLRELSKKLEDPYFIKWFEEVLKGERYEILPR